MADSENGNTATGRGIGCIDISLQSIPSRIKAGDGREIPFTRAILMMRNVSDAEVIDLLPQATLGQEGGTVQDVSNSLSHSAPSSIPPNGTISWDIYDLLLPAHQGTASKIHMFGYRAALNWLFDLAAWATYRTSASSDTLKTPVLRWSLQWSVADSSIGAVGLTVKVIKD